MKKFLTGLFVGLSVLAVLHVEGRAENTGKAAAIGTDFEKGDLKYEVTGRDSVEIAGFAEKAENTKSVIVSDFELVYGDKKYSVEGIKDSAFTGNKDISGVYIGTVGSKYGNENFTIGSGAFKKCTSVNSVYVFKSNTLVGEDAFADCSSLSNNNLCLKVAAENISIGSGAFTGFNDVEFSCTRTGSIEKGAFSSTIESLGTWSSYGKAITEKLTKSGVSVIDEYFEAAKYK